MLLEIKIISDFCSFEKSLFIGSILFDLVIFFFLVNALNTILFSSLLGWLNFWKYLWPNYKSTFWVALFASKVGCDMPYMWLNPDPEFELVHMDRYYNWLIHFLRDLFYYIGFFPKSSFSLCGLGFLWKSITLHLCDVIFVLVKSREF